MRLNLNQRVVDEVKPKDRRIEYTDGSSRSLPGFLLSVPKTGQKSYQLLVRVDGRQRRHRLGEASEWGITLDEARTIAHEIIFAAKKGQTVAPDREEQNGGPTVSEVAEEYVERYARPNKKSWKEDQRIIRKEIVPQIGNLPIQSVTRADIRRVIDVVANRPAIHVAVKTLQTMRYIFTWATGQDLCTSNPCEGIRPPAKVQLRDRVLDDAEIRMFWNACEEINHPVGHILQFCLLSGQRKSACLEATWDEFDMDAGIWEIGKERQKSKHSHRVPITEPMRRVLDKLKSLNPDSRFVLPHPTKDRAFGNPQLYIERIRQASGITERYTSHDLRRSACTRMAELGTPEAVVAKLADHAGTGSVTARHYIRASFETTGQKREALEIYNRHIMVVVSGLSAVEQA